MNACKGYVVEIASRPTRFTGMILPTRLVVYATTPEDAKARAFAKWMTANFDVTATPRRTRVRT